MSKNIILCSDGTGNSGGKGFGTNVWRLYKAIDLHHSRAQVSFYDDGVGTRSFVLFKLLGGAFGWGLKRNIKRLYKFIVVQYEPGDDIFFFGFSRGAHTVRMVAGMLCRSGLVDRTKCASEQELDTRIDEAYDAFVKCFERGTRQPKPHSGSPEDQAQYSVNKATKPAEEPAETKKFRQQEHVIPDIPIKFIGVWDTVNAVGVPFDELREGLDLFKRVAIFDKTLHRLVQHGCHALSIDDQRQTFHPVLWDQSRPLTAQTIEQVWFAGGHANVGGGYPKNEMALVPLNWMMAKAKNLGVEFVREMWDGYQCEADIHSKLYDSRAGLAAYYRYLPRDIKKICREHGIAQAKIHVSVFDRIQRATEGYAPFNLPDDFILEKADENDATGFEASLINSYAAERSLDPNRAKLLGKIWDLVWIKRWLYILTLTTTGFGLYVLYLLDSQPAPARSGELYIVGWIFAGLGWLLPDIFNGALEGLRSDPRWLFLFAVIFGVLVAVTKRLDRRICNVSNASWRYVFENHRQQAQVKFGAFESFLLDLAWRLRNSWLSRRFMPFVRVKVMPGLALIAMIALLAWLIWKGFSARQ